MPERRLVHRVVLPQRLPVRVRVVGEPGLERVEVDLGVGHQRSPSRPEPDGGAQRGQAGVTDDPPLGSSGATGTEIDGCSVPPSTSNTLPVTHDDASDARYSTAQAMSSGSPGRRIGVPVEELLAQRVVGEHDSRERVATPPTSMALMRHARRELGRHVARQPVEGGLRGAVGGERRLRHARRARRDVDDRLRRRRCRPSGRAASFVSVNGGGHVEVEGALEEALARLHRRPRHGAAGVVDEDVEPPELGDRRARRDARGRRHRSRRSARPALAGRHRAPGRRPRRGPTAVRAASTTSAPASARPMAMPRPMPSPAPVTTATRSSTRKRSRITGAAAGRRGRTRAAGRGR